MSKRFAIGKSNNNESAGGMIQKLKMKAFNYQVIPIEKVRPSDYNSYEPSEIENIKNSIRQWGLFDNFLLAPIEDEQYEYEIVGGEQRYWAIKTLIEEGDERYLPGLPSNIIPQETSLLDRKIMMEESNIKRRQMGGALMSEHINALQELYKEKGIKNTTKEIAQNVGIGERQVQRYLSIEKLIPELKEAFESSKLNLENAAQFASKDKETQQLIASLLREKEKISKQEAEEITKKMSELEVKLGELNSELSINQKKYQEAQQEIAEKEESIEKIKNEEEELKNQLSQEKKESSPDEGKVKALEDEIKKLQQDKSMLEEKHSSADAKLSALQEYNKKLEEEVNQAKDDAKNNIFSEQMQEEYEIKVGMKELEEKSYRLTKKLKVYEKKYGEYGEKNEFYEKISNVFAKKK